MGATATTVEWCWVCLQDDTRVVATKRVNKVALCPGCYNSYKDEPEVLAHVTEYYKRRPPEAIAPIERYGEVGLDDFGHPLMPIGQLQHFCICGCGGKTQQAGTLLPGHTVKMLPKAGADPEPEQAGEPENPLLEVSDEELSAKPPGEEDKSAKWTAMLKMLALIETHTPQKVKLPEGGTANVLRCMLGQSRQTNDWRWKVQQSESGFVYVTKAGAHGRAASGFSQAAKRPQGKPRRSQTEAAVIGKAETTEPTAADLEDVLTGHRRKEGEMADPLVKAGIDIEAAAERYKAGESMPQIARSLSVPEWRFSQSPKWTEAKKGLPVPRKDSPRAKDVARRTKKEIQHAPAPVEGKIIPSSVAVPVNGNGSETQNHIRFLLLDAKVTSGNLSELTKAIADAMARPRE